MTTKDDRSGRFGVYACLSPGEDAGDARGDGGDQHPAAGDEDVGKPLLSPGRVECVLLAEIYYWQEQVKCVDDGVEVGCAS